MLLAALVLHSQLIIGRSTNHIAGAVFLRHRIDMPRVVQRMRNIRPVRVAFVESNRHLRATGSAGSESRTRRRRRVWRDAPACFPDPALYPLCQRQISPGTGRTHPAGRRYHSLSRWSPAPSWCHSPSGAAAAADASTMFRCRAPPAGTPAAPPGGWR